MESDELREQMERAESTFDQRVAMTMAIVAALLASVTMLSHRAHNETLLLQGDANRLQTQANIYHTQASDQWGYFQAKNIRNYQYQAYLDMLPLLTKQNSSNGAGNAAPVQNKWATQVKKYETELPQLQSKAEDLVKKAHEAEEEAHRKLEESTAEHHKGDRFDVAELCTELALVLCSLAVLTKRGPFWYSGIAACTVGVVLAVSALTMR
jgi:hypothetical protein